MVTDYHTRYAALAQAQAGGGEQMQVTEQMIERKYLSVRQAEHYTGLSRWTLMRAHERGELPLSRVGSAVRFSIEDLDSFMKARRT